jgi:glycerol-3-phosphate acyltransferase PlsX
MLIKWGVVSMAKKVNIAVDAMGGDNAPSVVLDGVALALESDENLTVSLCGPASVVEPFVSLHKRAHAVCASEVIAMGEHPAEAVRTKKDSSIVVGSHLVREGGADGFFSAGSTGACLAAATLIVGRIKGIKRPCLGMVLPTYNKPSLLLDVGANADCKPEYLLQFAQMGQIYMSEIMGVETPSVALLNIGEEDAKGNAATHAAHELLRAQFAGFAGNCEPHDLLEGKIDVAVCDGFTGNIALKTIEGTAKMVMRYMRDAITSNTRAKLGAALVKPELSSLKQTLSPDAYGGTALLGVKGAYVIGHGSSNALAIKNGILVAAKTARTGVCQTIEKTILESKLNS